MHKVHADNILPSWFDEIENSVILLSDNHIKNLDIFTSYGKDIFLLPEQVKFLHRCSVILQDDLQVTFRFFTEYTCPNCSNPDYNYSNTPEVKLDITKGFKDMGAQKQSYFNLVTRNALSKQGIYKFAYSGSKYKQAVSTSFEGALSGSENTLVSLEIVLSIKFFLDNLLSKSVIQKYKNSKNYKILYNTVNNKLISMTDRANTEYREPAVFKEDVTEFFATIKDWILTEDYEMNEAYKEY